MPGAPHGRDWPKEPYIAKISAKVPGPNKNPSICRHSCIPPALFRPPAAPRPIRPLP